MSATNMKDAFQRINAEVCFWQLYRKLITFLPALLLAKESRTLQVANTGTI